MNVCLGVLSAVEFRNILFILFSLANQLLHTTFCSFSEYYEQVLTFFWVKSSSKLVR